VPLSKALNPNLLQGCSTMTDPVKQHISLPYPVYVTIKYLNTPGPGGQRNIGLFPNGTLFPI
jgi:hypothetical protein